MTNLESESPPLPPPAYTAVPPHERRWARSDDDRVVLGVAGGLGRALAIEPIFIRIAFVVLALFSGVGVVLYLTALALLANSPTASPPSTIRRLVGALGAMLCGWWVLSGDLHLPDAGWVVAIGLLGAAVALWRGRSSVDATAAPPAVEISAAPDGSSTTDRWDSWVTQRRERPRPPRSVLGLLTLGVAAVAGATAWLLRGDSDNRGAIAFGCATVVIGAGLLVGAVAGRARWLIIPGLGAALAAVTAAAIGFAGVGITGRTGGRSEYVGPGSSVAAEYRTGIGSFDLWLVDYPGDVSTTVEVGVGDLTVVVPDDARVQVDARVGAGAIDALGSSHSGYRRTLSLDTHEGTRLIKLKLRVGVGHIEVRRGSFVDPPLIIVPTSLLPLSPFPPDVPIKQIFGDGTVPTTEAQP